MATTYARSHTEPSIEWLADQSDAIGIYTVAELQITDPPVADNPKKGQWGMWGVAALKLTLVEAKKGIPPAKFQTNYFIPPMDPKGISRVIAKGHQLLCFPSVREDTQEIESKSVFNLDSLVQNIHYTAFSSAFTVLRSRAEIMSALDARLKHPGEAHVPVESLGLGGERPSYWVEVPWGTAAFQALYGGSACYLMIPKDLRPKTASPTPDDPRR